MRKLPDDTSLAAWRSHVAGCEIHRNPHAPDQAQDVPLVSIVTPCLNAAEELPTTLRSIRELTWPNLEVIIVDGASEDATVQIIKDNQDLVSAWISEPDSGIAEAFNKCVALASGEYVIILNAGDALGPDHINRSVEQLQQNPQAGFSVVTVKMFDPETEQVTRQIIPRTDLYSKPLLSMVHAGHPGMLVRTSTYEAVGLFDLRYRICMDFDWILRCKAAGIQPTITPDLHAMQAEGGLSNIQTDRRDRENHRIMLEHREVNPVTAWCVLGLRSALNLMDRHRSTPGIGPVARFLLATRNRILGRTV